MLKVVTAVQANRDRWTGGVDAIEDAHFVVGQSRALACECQLQSGSDQSEAE